METFFLVIDFFWQLIDELFSKTSLLAPILASAKHELILKVGPLDLFSNYSISSDYVDNMTYGGIKNIAFQKDVDGDYLYFLIEKDLSKNPPDTIALNSINITIFRQG